MQHLYSVTPDSKQIKCLSCDLKVNNNTLCTYNSADFSPDYSTYAITCAGPDVPQILIYSDSGKELLLWENNEDLRQIVNQKKVPITKKFTFNIADGFTARVSLKLPPNLDTSGNTKYPMLVNV